MQRSRHFAVVTAAVIGLALTPPALSTTLNLSGTAATAEAATSKATALRFATFNVRTSRARTDKQSWLQRSPAVAREILSRKPGVVAIQELGPGRADGLKGTLHGTARQTSSLMSSLGSLGGNRYKLVRSTPYVAPGTAHGTQGTRILYDSSRYSVLSNCPETTGKRSYNRSCSFDLPLNAGDSNTLRRAAAFASLRDRRTGKAFFVVSAHLDDRHSKASGTEAKYNSLRGRQASAIAARLAKVNTHKLPVVFGGDINSWQTDRGHYAPHRALAARGYRDAVAAKQKVNIAFPTINHFQTTVKKAKSGSGVRLDVVMVKGGKTFKRYENKMARVNAARPSDHNMVVADLTI